MINGEVFDKLLAELSKLVLGSLTLNETLAEICRMLKNNIPYYNWVGFYLVNDERELVLGPFEGEPTEHTRIPFGVGICGQAAESKETFLVQDVSTQRNYLSCSRKVKAEIVVPILKDGQLVGELDIASHQVSPFSEHDREFLEEVCRILSGLFQ